MTSERITSPTGERPRLLLLEDDAGVRRSLQLLFRARGFDVRASAAGAALLADPAACDACCFIADYRLDENDGIEVFCHFMERGGSGTTVLLTAFPSADSTTRSLAPG